MERANKGLTWFWAANFPPVIALYLFLSSDQFQSFCLLYLALVSIWANVAGSVASWIAAAVAVAQERDKSRVPEKVVEKIIENTTVDPLD